MKPRCVGRNIVINKIKYIEFNNHSLLSSTWWKSLVWVFLIGLYCDRILNIFGKSSVKALTKRGGDPFLS